MYTVDRFISGNIRKLNRGENSVWRDLYDGKINSDIVIYGASRAWQHIDPKILSDSLNYSAYNLGIQGYDFRIQYLRHLLLLKYNRKPKLIIQTIDFLTFQTRNGLLDPSQYLPYMLYEPLMKKYTSTYTGYTWYDYEIPLVRYYGQIAPIHQAFSIFFNKLTNPIDRVKGYASYDQTFVNAFNQGDAYPNSYQIQFDPKTVQLFNDYLLQCQKLNIKIVFVYTLEYIAGQKTIKNRIQLFSLIHNFSKKYNVILYDYSNDEMSFNKNDFYNSEHMNTKGAQLFSKKLARDLEQGGFAINR